MIAEKRGVTALIDRKLRRNNLIGESVERCAVLGNTARSKVRQLKPKAEYCETVLQCPDAVTVATIAKDYGWSTQKLNAWLAQQGIQHKCNNTWQICRKYAQKGYIKTRTVTYTTYNGVERAVVHTCWTQEGRKFLYELLAQHGILPMQRIASN